MNLAFGSDLELASGGVGGRGVNSEYMIFSLLPTWVSSLSLCLSSGVIRGKKYPICLFKSFIQKDVVRGSWLAQLVIVWC